MKKIIARFAILFGLVAIALLCASTVAAWWISLTFVAGMQRFADRTADRLNKLDARLVRLEEAAKNVTVDVGKVRTAAAALIQPALKHIPTPMEFEQLLERLERLLEQSATLGETLCIVSRLLEDAADLRSQFGQSDEQLERMRTIADSLDSAASSLQGIRDELSVLRKRQVEPDLRALTGLAERTELRQDRMVEMMGTIRQQLAQSRDELAQLFRKARFWSIVVAIVLTVVSLWLALGQVCLVGWGRRSL